MRPPEKKSKKPVRVFTDGCFDMMHYGHANALRQARALGDVLVVGVHSDEEIRKHKGPPVMKEDERYKAVRACKWVDEVVEDAPYAMNMDMMKKLEIDYCVHGDDLVVAADGSDCYAEAKAAGMFRTIPRTKGVSTTDLVGRMLLMTKSHHQDGDMDQVEPQLAEGPTKESPFTRLCKFIPTTSQIVQFAEGNSPKEGDRIGYIAGAWDLFHVGHISVLEAAKKECDYLIVGVHDDRVVNKYKGENHPVANLHERVLGVLSCKYVDEVVIGAPYVISKEMIAAQGISFVFVGVESDPVQPDQEDPNQFAEEMGLVRVIKSGSDVTTSVIIERIFENRARFLERNRKKEAREYDAVEAMKKAK